jgi:inner membrane protein involved in colicin E2 resistance
LTVPYTLTWKDDHGQQQRAVRRAHFLPKDIQFDASLVTTQRERGIFHMIVYSTELAVRAQVHPAGPFIVRPPPTSIEWGDVTLSVGISDPKALTRRAAIDWNGRAEPFTSGIADVGIFSAGIQARGRALDSDIRSSQRPHVFGSWELGVGS